MLDGLQVARLAAWLSGLCMAISASATPFDAQQEIYSPVSTQAQAQNGPAGSAQTGGVEVFAVPDPRIASMPEGKALARIALLLPLQSSTLAQAADAVRAGFLAAAEREGNPALSVEVVESGETPEETLSTYARVVQDHDIVVGPLPRSGVNAVAYSGAVSRPTVALAQIDMQDEGKIILPGKMLAMGLSVEDEARQVAALAHNQKLSGKAVIVLTPAAWQRRAAKAFADHWQRLGHESELMEMDIAASGVYLGANGLVQLKKRIQADKPAFLFAALDALQTRQMRMYIGNDVPVYGTSQLNSFELQENADVPGMPEMNGVKLVDIPWLIQPDNPAVMAYPKPVYPADQKRNADLERLYGLGIDAFRVATELASNRSQFQIDGVTGKLNVDFNKRGNRFERTEVPAVYRNGKVLPLTGAP